MAHILSKNQGYLIAQVTAQTQKHFKPKGSIRSINCPDLSCHLAFLIPASILPDRTKTSLLNCS